MPQKTAVLFLPVRAVFMILSGLSLFPFSAGADSLEDSPLYQAVWREDLPAFLRAVDTFKSFSEPKKIKWVEARDKKGGNIFHLLAGVKKYRQRFALEMIRLAVVPGRRDFLDARDNNGLRPEEVAQREGNHQALEMFHLLRTESDLTLEKEYEIRKHEKQFEILDAVLAATGAIMVGGSLYIMTDIDSGREYVGYIDPALPFSLIGLSVGALSSLAGGIKCYDFFKKRAKNKKRRVQ